MKTKIEKSLKPQNTWLAFVEKEDTINQLNSITQKSSLNFIVNQGNIYNAIEHIKKDNSYKLLLIDITTSSNIDKEMELLEEYSQEGTKVIALGEKNDIIYYKKLKNLGIDDYLMLPLNPDLLFDILKKILSAESGDMDYKTSNPLITVIGTKGGVGTSTLALNTAWIFAKEYDSTVCYLDFDLYFGTSILSLNLEHNQGLAQALINADRLDDVFLKRLTIVKNNLYILAAEQTLEQELNCTSESISKLLSLIRQNFDYSIVELTHNIDGILNPALATASHIIILSDFSIPSLRDTTKLLQFINSKNPFAKTKIAVVKNPATKGTELTLVQFETGIKQQVDFIVPFERNATLEAINKGKLLAIDKPNNKLIYALREITDSITSLKTKKGKFSLKTLFNFWR